jgi:hypothetical protein
MYKNINYNRCVQKGLINNDNLYRNVYTINYLIINQIIFFKLEKQENRNVFVLRILTNYSRYYFLHMSLHLATPS